MAVVAPPGLELGLARDATIVRSAAAGLGMSRSLTLESDALGRHDLPIVVLLVDTPEALAAVELRLRPPNP